VFTRPDDLSDAQIGAELAAGWDFAARSLSYLPVGFGSHHWLAIDPVGRQLFLVVHDLPAMLHRQLDTANAVYGRLSAAFECAVSLRRDENLEFVVAPVAAADGTVVRRLSQRYSLAVCPYLTDCEPSPAGGFTAEERPAVLHLLITLHRAAPPVVPQAVRSGIAERRRTASGYGQHWPDVAYRSLR
jgi:spectinomycin phosphotransferase